jgi:Ca-activated chloride channel homolog
MSIRFDQPQLLYLLLLTIPVAWLGWRSLAALEPARRWTAIVMRLAVLVLVVLILAGIQSVRRHDDLTVVALLEQSQTVQRFAFPPGAGQDKEPSVDWFKKVLRDAAESRRPDDGFSVITFDGRATVRKLPSPGIEFDLGTGQGVKEGSNPAEAIRLGLTGPGDTSKRLILAWTGNATVPMDEVLAAAREAKAAGVPVDVLPIEYRLAREVMVESVTAPMDSRQKQTVTVRVVLSGTQPADGVLYLNHEGVPIHLSGGGSEAGGGIPVRAAEWLEQSAGPAGEDAAVSSSGARYLYVKKIDVPLTQVGPNRFEARFVPVEGSDTSPSNNSAEGFTYVQGTGRVLLMNHNLSAESGRILADVLRSRGVEIDVYTRDQTDDQTVARPTRMTDLQRYDAVILQNMPAEEFTTDEQKMLARYVNDLGGGLVMIGGPDSFGAGGWTETEVDRILPVNCRIANQRVLPSGALIIVMDRSGSMGGSVAGTSHSQQEVANEAAVLALDQLYPQDLIGVVAFDHTAKWIVNLTPADHLGGVAKAIRSIQPGGGTDIYPALVEAYNALAPLSERDAAVRHVILLTDGNSQDGDYVGVVGKMARAGITLTTIGIGDSVDAKLLKQLAHMGNGTYYEVKNPRMLPQVFIKEARTIRKNLVKEVNFTPKLVPTASPIVQGLKNSPPLRGLVVTGSKNDPRVMMPLLGPEDEPLFAHWQVGLGRAAAFTSDASNRWAVDWLPWGGYADFWTRMVRAVARPPANRAFDLTSTIRGDRLHVRLNAMAPTGTPGSGTSGGGGGASFSNYMDVQGAVLMPDGSTARVHLQQTGPGVYEADLPANQAGNYIVNLFTRPGDGSAGTPEGSAGGNVQAVFGGVSRPPGRELRTFASDRANMEEVAAAAGGHVLDPSHLPSDAFFNRLHVQPSVALRPLWRPLLLILLACFLVDVAVRRIAWDLAAMRLWAVGRIDALAGLLKTRKMESEATLTALKRKSAEVEQHLARRGAAERTPPAEVGTGVARSEAGPPPLPTSTRTTRAAAAAAAVRKFEADERYTPDEDFTAAVGGAADETVLPPQPGRNVPAGPAPATTSRLLEAKRRARQKSAGDDKPPDAAGTSGPPAPPG